MVNTVTWSGNRTYNVNHYVVDYENEVDQLPKDCAMGSTATVIATGALYIFNSKKQWVKQPAGSSSGSGSSGSGNGSTASGDIIILGDKNPSPSNDDITIL